jgi:predicted ATPase
MRSAFERHSGYEVDCEGDSFFVAFPRAEDATLAAVEAQKALAASDQKLRIRMGLHTGEPLPVPPKYVGLDVHRAARLMSAAHGGQVVVSQTTRDLIAGGLPPGLRLRDLGKHRLKDLLEQENVYQLEIDGLPSVFPPLRTVDHRPTNLPVQPNPFIGRENELRDVATLVRDRAVRLVTLTGAGGTGKTRVALQVGAETLEDFEDGVFFISLAAIKDPQLVVPAIAQALALRETPGEELVDTLVAHLCDKEMLLIVDNCEQIVSAVASWFAKMLAAAPQVKVLATSRARLRLAAERIYEVPPLQLPDLASGPDLDALMRSEAVALFVDRARAARPEFTPTETNARALAEICTRLDGLPLALELAAARVTTLTPTALLRRLDQRLSILVGGARDTDERQQTLRDALQWSYELLDEGERATFGRMGVFVGGGRLEAAESVAAANGQGTNGDVLNQLQSLTDASLMRQIGDSDDEPRFWMLETVREFAVEKLEQTGVADEVRERHANYVLRLCEQAVGPLSGMEHGEEEQLWVQRLKDERENLRAALSWTIETGRYELALRIAAAASWFWLDGPSEGIAWLTRVLEATEGHVSPARAEALAGTVCLAHGIGDARTAQAIAPEALAACKQTASALGEARCLNNLAFLAVEVDADLELADRLAADANAAARKSGSPVLLMDSLGAMAMVAGERGHYDAAVALAEEALLVARKSGAPGAIANATGNVGWFAMCGGELGRAREAFEGALSVMPDPDRLMLAMTQSNLGVLSLLEGQPDRAVSAFEHALEIFRELGEQSTAGEALRGLAAASAAHEPGRAARLTGAADALVERNGVQLAESERMMNDRYLTSARAALGDDVWISAWNEGRTLPIDEAITYALRSDRLERAAHNG